MSEIKQAVTAEDFAEWGHYELAQFARDSQANNIYQESEIKRLQTVVPSS